MRAGLPPLPIPTSQPSLHWCGSPGCSLRSTCWLTPPLRLLPKVAAHNNEPAPWRCLSFCNWSAKLFLPNVAFPQQAHLPQGVTSSQAQLLPHCSSSQLLQEETDVDGCWEKGTCFPNRRAPPPSRPRRCCVLVPQALCTPIHLVRGPPRRWDRPGPQSSTCSCEVHARSGTVTVLALLGPIING